MPSCSIYHEKNFPCTIICIATSCGRSFLNFFIQVRLVTRKRILKTTNYKWKMKLCFFNILRLFIITTSFSTSIFSICKKACIIPIRSQNEWQFGIFKFQLKMIDFDIHLFVTKFFRVHEPLLIAISIGAKTKYKIKG